MYLPELLCATHGASPAFALQPAILFYFPYINGSIAVISFAGPGGSNRTIAGLLHDLKLDSNLNLICNLTLTMNQKLGSIKLSSFCKKYFYSEAKWFH